MKIIDTNKLNRFWKNGVKPIKDEVAKKLSSSKVANNLLTTVSGYALDARQGKVLNDKISEINTGLVTVHMPTIAFANDTEMMSRLNNVSDKNGTWYRLSFAHITGVSAWPVGSGGIFYIEGFRSDQGYEWQRASSYGLSFVQYARVKYDGVWRDWEEI